MKLVVDNSKKTRDSKKDVSDIYLLTKEFTTATEFSYFIEVEASRTNSSCMDTLIDYCEKKEIEIEGISKFINSSLKERIKQEAIFLNLVKIKKEPRLEF